MYITLVLLSIILMPLPAVLGGLRRGTAPYTAVMDGTLSASLASIVFFIAAALSQVVDTLIFITVSFLGERPILGLMAGQMLAKVVLSAVMVPAIIWIVVRLARRMDAPQKGL